ncbi:hypothetical protein [Formosa sp. A9]|uniref:hypothetical protein n=1 Tax=Formosa sp. A9 TaxID=3442641 RepID=UPI003EBEBC72
MITADAKQKQIIAILTRGDKDFKAQLVVNMTGDSQKSSTNHLSFAQANAIIKQLGGSPVPNPWTTFNGAKASHRNILSLCMQLGWQFYDQRAGRYFANMAQLGAWLQNKAPVKKPLPEQSAQEISKTIIALENMVKGYAKKTALRQ